MGPIETVAAIGIVCNASCAGLLFLWRPFRKILLGLDDERLSNVICGIVIAILIPFMMTVICMGILAEENE